MPEYKLEWADVAALLPLRKIKIEPNSILQDGGWRATLTAEVRSMGTGATEQEALDSLKKHIVIEINERLDKQLLG